MSVPRYSHYRASDVPWLREVPAHWAMGRLKLYLRLLTEKSDGRTNPVALQNIEGCSGRFLPTESEFQGDGIAFECGDILFGKLRPYLAKVYLADASGEAVGDFHVLRPNRTLLPRYIQYQLLSRDFIAAVDASTFGSKMPRVSWDFLSNMPLLVPSYEEQLSIATFLDRETSKIDALIAEQEKLLALLAEKRQATISRAVTSGLDPDVPMKHSGVAWLGQVPAHWRVCPLKYLARIGNGSTPSRDNPKYWAEEGYPWLNSSVANLDEVTRADQFVTSLALEECHLPIIEPPAVLVGITGQGKTRGMATKLLFEATVNQHLAYIKPNEDALTVSFLLRALEMAYEHLRTESDGAGSTKGAITCQQLGQLAIPLPDIREQGSIAAFLHTETAKLDTLYAEAQRAIELLKERRSALIAAAVTGKIDVRNAVPEELAA